MTKNIKVLLVEDNKINAQVVIMYLKGKLRCDVEHVWTGEDAVKACEKTLFDLVVMDVGLPGISGLEATQQILIDDGKNSSTPIVALTARDTEEDKRRCLDSGMKEMLIKPASFSALQKILNEYVE